jgi:hypothetical protein
MTVSSNNNLTDGELSLLTSLSVPVDNKLTDKELLLQTSLLLFPLASALSELSWPSMLQPLLPLLSSQKWTDYDENNLALSEEDDGCKEGLSEACLAYGLMIDAILVMVPRGEKMPAADGGDAEVSPSLEKKRRSLFGGWGRLLRLSMN